MWLDDLDELVAELAQRINEHRSVLTKSESTTRYALINPLLAGLGWDLSDPHQVLTEYEASYASDDKRHYADYVMWHGKRPCLVVEAKSLGTRLATGDALDQGTKYCNRLGSQHFVLTDGDRWEAHDRADPRKPVFEFDVTGARNRSVIELLWLWRGNFKGTPTRPQGAHESPSALPGGAAAGTEPPSGSPSLADCRYNQGAKAPRRIIFPDGRTESISTWPDIQVKTAKWLIEAKLVKPPLKNGRDNHLIHSIPERKDGRPFRTPRRVSGLWIETHYNPTNHLRKAREMVEACGQDPARVTLDFADS